MNCPDPETLATLLEGKVSEETRDEILDHLGTCEYCYEAFQGAARYVLEEEAKARSKKRRSAAKKMAASAAVITVLAALAWTTLQPLLTERPITPLVEAMAGQRPTEARLAGDFRHATYTGPNRSTQATSASWSLAAASLQVEKQAERRPTPGRIETLGLAHLLTGDTTTATLLIREALDRRPDDETFLTDLAATSYTRYTNGEPEALVDALEAASKAETREARFNRALALTSLHLHNEARLAWRTYASNETDPEWIAEARDHLAQLDHPHPGAQTDATRIQDTLLPQWGSEALDGKTEAAAATLQTARALNPADPLLAHALREITRSKDATRDHLARGHQEFGLARKAFEAFSLTDAALAFARAREEFESAASPYALWARVWEQACRHLQGQPHEETLTELGALRKVAEDNGYTLLLARVLWLTGLIYSNALDIPASLKAYKTALDLMNEAGEQGSAAFLEYLVSEDYFVLGDQRHTWQYRLKALATAPSDDPKYPGILFGSGFAILTQDKPEAALYFLREAAHAAEHVEDDAARAEAAIWQGRTLHSLGRDHEAANLLAAARSALSRVPDEKIRGRINADVTFLEGLIESDPQQAAIFLAKALTNYAGPTYRLPLLYLERARALLQMGQREDALKDLRSGFDLVKDRTPGADLYLSLGSATELIDTLVELEARDSPRQAFTTLETSRAKGLRPASLAQVQKSLAKSTAMLYYSHHHHELLTWTITREKALLTRRTVEEGELTRLAHQFTRSFTLDHRLTGDAARKLSEILLGKNRLIEGASTLIVIPDEDLAAIPYAALGHASRYLGEEAAVLVAPSATHYLHAKDHPDKRVERALIIGEPTPDPQLFPGLPSLPGAAEEARKVAGLYHAPRVLLGEDATRQGVLRDAPIASVIHYSGHATDAPLPAMAGLVLSPQPDESSLLLARDIENLDLSHVRLVVLSACNTQGLANAFLNAGAKSVLVSLWPVQDQAATRVIESFHQHFLEGLDPAHALQAAQREALHSGSSWAAFQLIGS